MHHTPEAIAQWHGSIFFFQRLIERGKALRSSRLYLLFNVASQIALHQSKDVERALMKYGVEFANKKWEGIRSFSFNNLFTVVVFSLLSSAPYFRKSLKTLGTCEVC